MNIQLIDVLALLLYLAVVCDIDARHAFQHIADGSVLLLGEAADIVGDGVALLPYAVGLDNHFFE